MSNDVPLSRRAVYAISLNCLDGFQAGASFQLPTLVSRRTFRPSASIT